MSSDTSSSGPPQVTRPRDATPASHTIRPLTASDRPAIKAVIDSTGLFPGAMLDDMVAGFLDGTDRDARWCVVVADTPNGTPAGVAYVGPERMTAGTWNLYLIAIDAARQGEGLGAALLRSVEAVVARDEGRVLLVETSGLPAFARTRAFYRANGYTEEARIRDFYAPGEDKIVFWKSLRA